MRKRLPIIATALILVVWRMMPPEGRGQNAPPPPSSATGAPGATGASGFTGAGSCASSSCHGNVWPRTGDGIQQNEYHTWSTRDKHAKAYSVLLEPRSKQIARNMRVERPETAALCLDCHAVNAPAGQRAATFDIADGVSCEACHGPASAWLGPHTLRGWKHEQSVALGMVDTKSPARSIEVCLSCHLGNEQKTVDHELIAAGHPNLIFEFETFSALMPEHWKGDGKAASVIRRWGISQAISLRESMEQLGRRAGAKARDGFPEFADFECSACHHDLVIPSSRQERGYPGRAGVPRWDESRYIVLRHLLAAISADQRKSLDSAIGSLKVSMQNAPGNSGTASENAARIAGMMNAVLPLIESQPLDRRFSNALMGTVAGDANDIAAGGAHSAAQAAMAMEVFYRAMTREGGSPQPAVNDQINVLYGLLQSDSRYDAEIFSRELRKLQSLAPSTP